MKRWILPPSLKWTFQEFIDLYDSLQGDSTPILIIGPRGVGKTLFAETFAKLHERDHPGSRTMRINIAAIPEALIESQLFGHKKGSFTGATSDYKGLIGEAHNGILILEEIGELKKDVQAKLLTFIEDGIYYQVGNSKEQRAKDIQIIATTNRPRDDKDFRKDFIDRFFPFYVPPLYERRGDILYYLAHKFPKIIKELRPWEILTLLAYNWPGNVREIETIGRVVRWQKANGVSPGMRKSKFDSSLYGMPEGYSSLSDGLLSIEKYGMNLGYLKQAGIDTELLESLLNRYNLSLDMDNQTTPFKDYEYSHKLKYSEAEELFDVEICSDVDGFENAYAGMVLLFGPLFMQAIWSERDMLDVKNGFSHVVGFFLKNEKFKGKYSKKRIDTLIDSTHKYVESLSTQHSKEPNIFNLTKAELLKYYYNGLIDRAGGNKAKAASLAGMKPDTFKSAFKKYCK